MADEWDKYKTTSTDEWSQYAVPKEEGSAIGDFIGSAIGLGAAGTVAYGIYKSGIPQKIAKGATKIASGVSNISKVNNPNKSSQFAKEIRGEFVKAYKNKIDNFGKDLTGWQAKYPQRGVDLSELVSDIQTNPNLSRQAIGILRRVPKLDNLLENPRLATNVSLNDAQDIVNYINTKIPKSIKFSNFDLLNAANEIRVAQLNAFPEIAQTRADYAPFIENYKNIKPQLGFNKILSAIKNKFGGAEGQVAVEEILPKEVVKKINSFRAAQHISDIPKDIPLLGRFMKSMGGALGVAPMAFQAWSNAKALEEAKKTGMYKVGINGEIIPVSREDLAI
jgi:hypothetical protein